MLCAGQPMRTQPMSHNVIDSAVLLFQHSPGVVVLKVKVPAKASSMTERGKLGAIILAVLIVVIIVTSGGDPVRAFLIGLRNHPWILTRSTAATVIEQCAQFRHKTRLRFEIAQEEGILPGVCHNFQFSANKTKIAADYLEAGAMKFSPYGNQSPPFPGASVGSIDLSIGENKFLLDEIDDCKFRDVTKAVGVYEVRLGKPIVNVTGIQKDSNQAIVDFTWHFESINEIGQALPRLRATQEMEIADPHMTADQKSIAPFWTGSAIFAKYDDGWRIGTITFGTKPWSAWEYGPDWPDPNFNWNGFDENENHY